MQRYHLIVYVPLTHADAVRDALARSGAGTVGHYDSCSFSSRGTGRFRPNEHATPHIGTIESIEAVDEERIETQVTEDRLRETVRAVLDAHPYEEPALHVIPMFDHRTLSV